MIKDSTKEKLRKAAKKVGLGRFSIYNRKKYSEEEIQYLVDKYKQNKGSFQDLFDKNKIHLSLRCWRNSISRKLDSDSCRRFYFKIENPIPTCKYCGCKLKMEDYRYPDGFNVYCITCIYRSNFNRHPQSKKWRDAISKGRKKWTKTLPGVEFYKKLGKYNSCNLKKHFKTKSGREQIERVAKIQSEIMKERIRVGDFTPPITNSWTHWTSKIQINGKLFKFRSSWEACFYLCYPHLRYEFIRIPYILNGIKRVYVSDFYDEKNGIMYEIKPTVYFRKQKKKIDVAIQYCLENNIKFIWINENNIMSFINPSLFKGENLEQYKKLLKGIKYHEKN